MGLDDPSTLATTLVAVDFSKSFLGALSSKFLQSYKDLNASPWCIDVHAAFLTNIRMQVKVGNVFSDPIPVTGGAVQGSILEVLDHNAVLESIDNNFTQPASKYVDDLIFEERTNKSTPKVVDLEESTVKERHTFLAKRTQKTMEKLEEQCNIKGLKLNEDKTQLLSISAGRVATRSWIKTKGRTTIYSSNTCKILGFTFSSKPNVESQVQNLIKKG